MLPSCLGPTVPVPMTTTGRFSLVTLLTSTSTPLLSFTSFFGEAR